MQISIEKIIRDGRTKVNYFTMSADDIRAAGWIEWERYPSGELIVVDMERDATNELRDHLITLADAGLIQHGSEARFHSATMQGAIWVIDGVWYETYVGDDERHVMRMLPGGKYPLPWNVQIAAQHRVWQSRDTQW